MKKILIVSLSLFVVIALSACTVHNKITEIKTIKVWVIAPLSGPGAAYGEDVVNAYTFMLEQMKKQGKMKGYTVEFVYEDGKCNGKDATSAAQKLITVDKVAMIIGWICSAETLAAAKVAQSYKIPILSPASSSPAISKLWEWVWRFYSDIDQATVMANHLNDKGAKNIAVIYENTDYAVDFIKTLKTLYAWTILVEEKINSDERDFGIVAKKIANQVSSLDAVVFVNGGTDSLFIWIIKKLEQEWVLKNLKWEFIGSDTLFSSSILDVVGTKMEWFLGATLPDDWTKYGPKVDSMMKWFEQQYGVKGVNFYIILYQEAINLVADMFDAGNRNPQEISEYLRSIDKGHPRDGYFGKYYFSWVDAQGLHVIFKQIINWKPEFMK